MPATPKLPDIPDPERTPLVVKLLEVIQYQAEILQGLKDEIAVLKGNKPKPNIKPGKMDKGDKRDCRGNPLENKRPGSAKRSKTEGLQIHETISVKTENIPDGSIFKGNKPVIVKGLIIKSHNTRYLLERWETPDGSYVVGSIISGAKHAPLDVLQWRIWLKLLSK